MDNSVMDHSLSQTEKTNEKLVSAPSGSAIGTTTTATTAARNSEKNGIFTSKAHQNVSLSAINHETNWTRALHKLYTDETFSDITLVCPGGQIKAHKVILGASSEHFATLLGSKEKPNLTRESPSSSPPVSTTTTTSTTSITSPSSSSIFLNVNFYDLRAVIEFLYLGQVVVPLDCLPSLLECARILMVTQMFNSKITYQDDQEKKRCYCKLELQPDQQRSRRGKGKKRRKKTHQAEEMEKRSGENKRSESVYNCDKCPPCKPMTSDDDPHPCSSTCSSSSDSCTTSSAHALSCEECAGETTASNRREVGDTGLDLRVKDSSCGDGGVCGPELRKKRPVDLEPLQDSGHGAGETTGCGTTITTTAGSEDPEESCFKVSGERLFDGNCIKQEPRDVVHFHDEGSMENLVSTFPHHLHQQHTQAYHHLWPRSGGHHYFPLNHHHHQLSGLTVPLSGSATGSSYFWTEEETATLIRVWCEESERARESGHRHLNIIRLQGALQSRHIYRTIDQIRRKIYKLKYAFRDFENDGKVSAQISAHLKMLRTMDRQFILSDT